MQSASSSMSWVRVTSSVRAVTSVSSSAVSALATTPPWPLSNSLTVRSSRKKKPPKSNSVAGFGQAMRNVKPAFFQEAGFFLAQNLMFLPLQVVLEGHTANQRGYASAVGEPQLDVGFTRQPGA